MGGADCSRTEGYDVVIVGAGLAGLTAGRELGHLGRSVLVLEATGRVGGRGFVGKVSGGPGKAPVPIDYGGAWIHGVPTNPLTGLVDLLGLKRVRSELDVPFFVDQRRATDEEYERFNEAYEVYEEALAAGAARVEYEKLITEEACASGEEVRAGSLEAAELCDRLQNSLPEDEAPAYLCQRADLVESGGLEPAAFCAEVAEKVQVTSDVAASYVPQDESFQDVLPLLLATAGPLETSLELGASSAVDAGGFFAGEDDLVEQGLGTFVERYGESVPVCLDSPVSRIDYGEDGVVVHTGDRRYRAATALVTVSVGVLRAGKIHFEPSLPAWKREAVESLHMGAMQKVIIPFDDDVFGDELSNAWVLYEGDVSPAEKALADRAGLAVPSDERRVMAFVVKPLGANIAIGFFGGPWAQLFESQCAGREHTSGPRSASGCDDPAIDASVRALSAMYGEETIQGAIEADEIHVTRWTLEPYTLGAYSVPQPGAWDQREALGRPVAAGDAEDGPLRLFFAGEACSRAIYNGSYAGAYETGLQAARDVHAELLQGIN